MMRKFVAPVLALLCSLAIGGSRATEATPAASPSDQAPTVVSVFDEPGHIVRYRSPRFVVYTNDFVPGAWTLYHRHRTDLLAIIAGETLAINQKLGSLPAEQAVPAGTVAFFPYGDMAEGYVHRISVGGSQPFINIGVDFQETLPTADRRAAMSTWNDPAVKLISDNRRGRAYQVELGARQSLALPEGGSALLLVALVDTSVEVNTTDVAPALWPARLGEFKFFEGDTRRPRQVDNHLDKATRMILFQAY